jgi:hypothetical protein
MVTTSRNASLTRTTLGYPSCAGVLRLLHKNLTIAASVSYSNGFILSHQP